MRLEEQAIHYQKTKARPIDKNRLVRAIVTKICYQMVKNNRSRNFSLQRVEKIRKKQFITWKEISAIAVGTIGGALILLSPLMKDENKKYDIPVIDNVEVIMTLEEEEDYYQSRVDGKVIESDFQKFEQTEKIEIEENKSVPFSENPGEEIEKSYDFGIQNFNPYMTNPEGVEYYIQVYSKLFGIDKVKLQEKIYNEFDAFCYDYQTPEAAVIEMANELYRKSNQVKTLVKDLSREEREAILIHFGRIYQLTNEQIAECIAISRCENPNKQANNYGGQLDKDMHLIYYPNIEIGAIRHIQCYLKHLKRAQNIESREIKEQMAIHGNLLGMNISYCTHNTPYTALYDEGWNLLGYQKNPYPQDGHDEYWYQVVEECKISVLDDYPWLKEDKLDLLSTHR